MPRIKIVSRVVKGGKNTSFENVKNQLARPSPSRFDFVTCTLEEADIEDA